MEQLKFLTSLCVGLMLLFSLRSAYLLIQNFKNINHLRLFIVVACFSFFETLLNISISQILKMKSIFLKITSISQNIYLIIEILAILIFYNHLDSKSNNIKNPKNVLIIFLIIGIMIFYGIYSHNLMLAVTISELLLVNYFFIKFTILEIKYDFKIYNQFESIINKGLFTFVNFIAPYTVINELTRSSNFQIHIFLNFINDIGYIILFYSLSKAAKCYQSR